jgi:hypothetical protein
MGSSLKLLSSIAKGLNSALGFVKSVASFVDGVLGYVDQVSSLLNLFGNVMTQSADAITGIMDSATNTATRAIGSATNAVDGANTLLGVPRTIQLKAINLANEVQNATNNLLTATKALARHCQDMTAKDGDYWKKPKDSRQEEFADAISGAGAKMVSAANTLVAYAKSAIIPDITVGGPDPQTGKPQMILSYGYISVVLKDTDTLESLAAEYLGHPDKAIDIATFNGIASASELYAGDIIKIPITNRTVQMENNLIFARREDRDNYGRDILLDNNGFIVMSDSDYALADGEKNLSQAVLMRLRESSAKRIRLNAYGIRNNINDPTAGIAYILSSIKLTVSSDPRISSVDGIRFKQERDYLNVEVFYRDINNAFGKAVGRI